MIKTVYLLSKNTILSKNGSKGMSQTIWVIVAATVLMIVALGVIIVFQSGFGDFGDWIDEGINNPENFTEEQD